jgi:hypothetical protein
VVEPIERSFQLVERVFCKDVLTGDITEVEKCVERLDDIGGYETFESIHEDLVKLNKWMMASGQREGNTFIKAFESLPVHCLKFRPCLNLRRPGKRGANAIL